MEYVEEMEQIMKENELVAESMEIEGDEDALNSTSATNIFLNVSVNRSGAVRQTQSINEVAVQTDEVNVERRKLRINQKLCTDEVKNTCVKLSSTCGVSTEMARKIVQVVCKNMYGHELYLTAEDQAKGEGTSLTVGSTKWKDRTYVIPSARTISDHKQYLATETETGAALALLDEETSVKAFIHFDTTSRNNIDDE